MLYSWIQLKGTRVGPEWVIPRPSIDPLPIDQVTARIGYSLLSRYEPVDHRSVAKFQDWGIVVEWKSVWSSLPLWRFVRSVQDTAWLSFHGILPTSDRLVRMRMAVNPLCFCQQPETLIHLFVTCPFAREIFLWFLSQFRKFNHVTALTSGEILFGFPSSSRVPVVFSALMGVLRHHIWLTRNRHRFESIPPDVPDTLCKARSTFRFLVRM